MTALPFGSQGASSSDKVAKESYPQPQQAQKGPLLPDAASVLDIGSNVKTMQLSKDPQGAQGSLEPHAKEPVSKVQPFPPAVQSAQPAAALHEPLHGNPLRSEPLQAMAPQQVAMPISFPFQQPGRATANPPNHPLARGQPSQAPAPAVYTRISGQANTGQVVDISLQPGQGGWSEVTLELGAENRTQEESLQLALRLQEVTSNTSASPRSVRTGRDPTAPVLPRSSLALESVPVTGARHPSAHHKSGAANLAAAAAPGKGPVETAESVSGFQTLASGLIRTVPYGAVTPNELWFDGPPPAGDASPLFALSAAPLVRQTPL